MAGAVRKVCRCEPVTDVTGVAAPRLDGNSLVLRPRCLKIRGIATPACALVRNDRAFSNSPVGSVRHPAAERQVPTRHLHWMGSIPFLFSQNKNSIPMGCCFCFGAGYGNRTRLCGLGSDHSTDELTLHCRYYSRWGRKNQCLFYRHRISLLPLEKQAALCYDRKKPSKGERLCFRKPF